MDVLKKNADAWDREVERGNRWTVPVGPEEIAAARRGEWNVLLTPTRPVPHWWFPAIEGCRVLCLASGGGQQGPIFAAAGANVTVLDASSAQLARDREVAERESLEIETVRGDMADLGCFDEGTFDLVFHPVSNCFAPAIRPVWQEAYRVLRDHGVLVAGFAQPLLYLFDEEAYDKGELIVRNRIPYSDVESLAAEERDRRAGDQPLEFGHTLDDQIGGQIDVGFILTGFYEDSFGEETDPLQGRIAAFAATRAIKPPTSCRKAVFPILDP